MSQIRRSLPVAAKIPSPSWIENICKTILTWNLHSFVINEDFKACIKNLGFSRVPFQRISFVAFNIFPYKWKDNVSVIHLHFWIIKLQSLEKMLKIFWDKNIFLSLTLFNVLVNSKCPKICFTIHISLDMMHIFSSKS